MAQNKVAHWHIFCNVIDNFGDIGVCWRLAKALHFENQITITLWVNNLKALATLEPDVNPDLYYQKYLDININLWDDKSVFTNELDCNVVLETFGCQLPQTFIDIIYQKKLLWINIEYLTAQSWAEDYHGLPSPQTYLVNQTKTSQIKTTINKYFYFPGFTKKTAGITFENKTKFARQNWQKTDSIYWLKNNINIPANSFVNQQIYQKTKTILYFAYKNTALSQFIKILQTDSSPTQLLIPVTNSASICPSCQQLKELLGITNINIGEQINVNNLTIIFIPFFRQEDFDKLLWSCDINFVRGEDSFVRAQIAGKPFIWSIYPQSEDYHLVKLQSFYSLLSKKTKVNNTKLFWDFNLAWNKQNINDKLWEDFLATSKNKIWQDWKKYLTSTKSLNNNLMSFVNKKNLEITKLL